MPVTSLKNLPEGEAKPSFQCAECGKSYSRSEYLRRHERKHQDSKPFPCTECSKSFARSDVLLRHRRKCHPDAPETAPVAQRASPTSASPSSGQDRFDSNTSPVSPEGGPSRTNGSSSTAGGRAGTGRDVRREAAAPYASQPHHLTQQTSFLPSDPSRSQGYPTIPGVSNFQLDPPVNYFGQHSQAGGPSPPSGSSTGSSPRPPSTFFSANGPDAESLALLASAGPSYIQQHQQLVNQYPMPPQHPSQQPHQQQPPPPSSASYFPSPNAAPQYFHSASTGFSPTENPNPAFLAPDRTVTSEWYPMFSPPLLTPLPTSSGPTQSHAALQHPLNLSAPSDYPFPHQPAPSPGGGLWSPVPGSFFDSLVQGIGGLGSPQNPEPNFLLEEEADEEIKREEEANKEMSLEKTTIDSSLASERTLLGADWSRRIDRSGQDSYMVRRDDPFWISADRFLGCYSVEHWQIPNLSTLTNIARRTLKQLNPHLPMIHAATFVLGETPGCLAFSMCTVGGPRRAASRKSWETEDAVLVRDVTSGGAWGHIQSSKGIVDELPAQAALLEPESSEEDGWDQIKSVVKREKTDMLIKSFTRSKGVLFTEYNVSLIQALILYNAPAFLSDSQGQRMSAQLNLGVIVNIARQVGIFDPTNDHVAPEKGTSEFTVEDNTLDGIWRRWARWEGIRRTAYVVFLLDTVACLESTTALHVAPTELASFPLPAADPIWEAPNAEEWSTVVSHSGHSYSLGDILDKLFHIVNGNEPNGDCLEQGRARLGPFGWLMAILVIVREVVDLGEGKARDTNVRWMAGVPQEMVGLHLQNALNRWRKGWDYDDLCRRIDPPSPCTVEQVESITPTSTTSGSDGSPDSFGTFGSHPSRSSSDPRSTSTNSTSSAGSTSKQGRQPYSDEIFCREALPFWWFAKILLDSLLSSSSPGAPAFQLGVNQFKAKGVTYRDVLESARVFSRAGEGRGFA